MKKVFSICVCSAFLLDSAASANWWEQLQVSREKPWWQDLKVAKKDNNDLIVLPPTKDPVEIAQVQKNESQPAIKNTSIPAPEVNKVVPEDSQSDSNIKVFYPNDSFKLRKPGVTPLQIKEQDLESNVSLTEQQVLEESNFSIKKDAPKSSIDNIVADKPELGKLTDSQNRRPRAVLGLINSDESTEERSTRRNKSKVLEASSLSEVCPEFKNIELTRTTKSHGRRARLTAQSARKHDSNSNQSLIARYDHLKI